MKTPAGHECRYYYQDFHRGRNVQECRLQKANPNSLPWEPRDCTTCPIAAILRANASPEMELTLTIKNKFFIFGREIEVDAHCTRHNIPIDDPHVGCSKCNASKPGLEIFLKALEESEPPSNRQDE
jgi:hypothetical protein